jgi:hypothetical protein
MSRSFFLMGPSCGSIAIMKLSLTITTTKLDHTTTAIDDDIIHVQEVGIQGSALSGSASSSTRFFHFIPR